MPTSGIPSGLTRLIRRCGLVRSPLLRPTDRVEGAVTALVLILAFVVASVAGAIGLAQYPAQLARAEAIASERVQTPATLIEDPVVPTNAEGAQALSAGATARVRWFTRDGREHIVHADVGDDQRAGDPTTVWTDRAGEPTPPPPGVADAVVTSVMAGILAAVVGWLSLGAVWLLVRRIVARLNAARWEHDWAHISYRWSPYI